jgi:hypothetical protein
MVVDGEGLNGGVLETGMGNVGIERKMMGETGRECLMAGNPGGMRRKSELLELSSETWYM